MTCNIYFVIYFDLGSPASSAPPSTVALTEHLPSCLSPSPLPFSSFPGAIFIWLDEHCGDVGADHDGDVVTSEVVGVGSGMSNIFFGGCGCGVN